jgi:pyridoxal 5'-phosphate synthase pdxT subunit
LSHTSSQKLIIPCSPHQISRCIVILTMENHPAQTIQVGVLALQGAFSEHVQLLRHAAASLLPSEDGIKTEWAFSEIRTPEQLANCDALIIPGGESTTMSLVAARSGMLEPLRDFVK